MTEVNELAPGEIQRGAGVSAGTPQAQHQQAQPAAPTPMPADRQASLTRAAELMARLSDPTLTGEQRERTMQKISAYQRHGFHGGESPEPKATDPKLHDMRPHDSLRDAFEAMQKPATPEILKAAVDDIVIKGVDRQLAQQATDVAAELGLSASALKSVLGRIHVHHGARHDRGPDTGLYAIEEAEVPEWAAEAARIAGSTEKFHDLTERARDFLQSKNLLTQFDKLGLTSTSLAFDVQLLQVLCAAADAAGLPNRKESK
jgi:hypothetical protein